MRYGIAVSLVMVFESQRLLLTLLDAIGEPVWDTDFQMLLFLYTQEGEAAPSYDFVPGKFGAFSFTSCADKQKLIEAGFLAEDDQNWKLTKAGRAEAQEAKVEGRMMNAERGPKPGTCVVQARYKPCDWEEIGRCKPDTWEVHARCMRGTRQEHSEMAG